MKNTDIGKSRRNFLKKATLGTALVSASPSLIAKDYKQKQTLERIYVPEPFGANDQINLALIGSGIQGIYDTQAALTVDGVKMVAACDLYTGRLDRAKELWGGYLG